ncbi:MAG: hypothetical protein Q8M19_09380 [Reyranella sp.]|nr:hypothetical protein [Reyranella sp.]
MRTATSLVALLCISLAVPAFAQGRGGPPDKAADQGKGQSQGKGQGQGQSQGKGQGQGQSQGQGNAQAGQRHGNVVVADRDRSTVQTYYRNEFAAGNCPPGLAKKNNGCLPPGLAKKLWAVGQPLPASQIFYTLPGVLLATLTPAPVGYQYVRVDDDVLLMVAATRMIANVVANLGG